MSTRNVLLGEYFPVQMRGKFRDASGSIAKRKKSKLEYRRKSKKEKNNLGHHRKTKKQKIQKKQKKQTHFRENRPINPACNSKRLTSITNYQTFGKDATLCRAAPCRFGSPPVSVVRGSAQGGVPVCVTNVRFEALKPCMACAIMGRTFGYGSVRAAQARVPLTFGSGYPHTPYVRPIRSA